MKILFVLINMNLGGTEKSFLNLLEQLPKDWEIDLLLLEDKGPLMDAIPPTVRIKTVHNQSVINAFLELGSRRFALQQLRKGNIELFLRGSLQFILDKTRLTSNPYWAIQKHVLMPPDKYDIAIAYAGLHNFISWYTLNRTVAPAKWLWVHFDIDKVTTDPSFGKNYYPQFSKIFCVSSGATAVFVRQFPSVALNTKTFPNFISSRQLIAHSQLGSSFDDGYSGIRILTVGRLAQEKGQHLVLDVAAKLIAIGFEFRWYLIGEGDQRSRLEQRAVDLGLKNNLIFLGLKENPYPYFRDCTLYVQPSLHEGFGITVEEAKVFCKPIVVTNFASASDLIVDGETGIIVDISVSGILNGVSQLLDDEPLRRRLSLNLKNGKKNDGTTSDQFIQDLFN